MEKLNKIQIQNVQGIHRHWRRIKTRPNTSKTHHIIASATNMQAWQLGSVSTAQYGRDD
jgi:hypothetical protein